MRSLFKLVMITWFCWLICGNHVLSLSSDSLCDLSFLLLNMNVRWLILNAGLACMKVILCDSPAWDHVGGVMRCVQYDVTEGRGVKCTSVHSGVCCPPTDPGHQGGTTPNGSMPHKSFCRTNLSPFHYFAVSLLWIRCCKAAGQRGWIWLRKEIREPQITILQINNRAYSRYEPKVKFQNYNIHIHYSADITS